MIFFYHVTCRADIITTSVNVRNSESRNPTNLEKKIPVNSLKRNIRFKYLCFILVERD